MQKQASLNSTTTELQQLRDMSSHQKKRIAEMLSNLLKELGEVGSALGGENNEMKISNDAAKLEEEFTVARLYISRMKSEVTSLTQRLQEIENKEHDSNKKVTEYEKELADCRLVISQHEARMKSLQESMREAENKKRMLEENIDSLREECAKLKAAEQVKIFYIFTYFSFSMFEFNLKIQMMDTSMTFYKIFCFLCLISSFVFLNYPDHQSIDLLFI